MNSTWLITSELANQRARKVLFTCVVYTIQSYQVVFLFLVAVFLKEIKNMHFVSLSSYKNARESLGELQKAAARVPTAFLVLSNFHSCFYLTKRFHVAVRLLSNRSQMTSKCGKNKKVENET